MCNMKLDLRLQLSFIKPDLKQLMKNKKNIFIPPIKICL